MTHLLHHTVTEMGMCCKTQLNYAALHKDNSAAVLDEEARRMDAFQADQTGFTEPCLRVGGAQHQLQVGRSPARPSRQCPLQRAFYGC